MKFSTKISSLSPSLTLAITAKAKEMKSNGLDVIGFGAGEPDFNTPNNIIQAAIKAMNEGQTKYTPASGLIELKNAIINKLKVDNNLEYRTSQVIVSTGAKQSLANLFMAILNPGDEVLIPIPYWVSYPELVKIADGVPVFVETLEDESFKYNVNILEKVITSKTKAIIINSPNNPTGTIYTEEELREIADFAKEHDLIIVSDEMYEKLIYGDGKHISIASISEDAYKRTVVINGLSKSYSMTGWRIGYAAGSEEIVKLMTNIQSHMTSNPNTIAQVASIEALNGPQDEVESMKSEFEKRRDFMIERINQIDGLKTIYPSGAFYVMVNISNYLNKKIGDTIIENSIQFSEELLKRNNVAVIPGSAFGLDNYIRLSYATSMDNIKLGLDRVEKFVNYIKKC
ncbi:aminotransferase [Clostridium polyendosporum]|uniref:Aminotransferase n=1 Tax=Clostridium polyendosporum TaxID=69208 RepID=A0A919VKP2_9CLOT|nr:pyridoxal phosphate-dependent aminotransferase [Clostridium polyendosporum]GIM27783.1 aminotransferase [Clostridium polyendosporum]